MNMIVSVEINIAQNQKERIRYIHLTINSDKSLDIINQMVYNINGNLYRRVYDYFRTNQSVMREIGCESF